MLTLKPFVGLFYIEIWAGNQGRMISGRENTGHSLDF